MAKTQKISQKRWLKGVNSAAQAFAQPPGSFPRGSNLIYIRRGSLVTCDGSRLISSFNGAPLAAGVNFGPMIEAFLYSPIGGLNTYFALIKDYNTHLGAPVGLAVAAGAAGVLNGTYKWEVTALDGAGGETVVSSEITQTLTNQKGTVTWTAVTNATGYNIYRTKVGGATGTELFSGTSATNSYTDNVADNALTVAPPFVDTTQVTQFYMLTVPSYNAAQIVFTFPADPPQPLKALDGTGGGSGGGGGGSGTGGGGAGAGGIAGNVSPIPQIIQFKNLMILLLGNGLTPYSSDGTTGNTIKLTNNFQASYASRTASTAQNVGDQISVTISAVNYIFTVTQAGITGSGGAPAFSAGEGSIIADGTVYWKNTGKVAAVTPPRGAAHGIVYAGSLWVGNTNPTATSDNFDGPSCLKMSDLNNPNSWNPLNVAFLDRDDGTQITGLATFTIAESGIAPTGSLVAFKDFSTFQINGVFGASNFSISRAQTDMGCSASRSIQFVPGFGIVRLTHLGFAMFDGVRDRILSEEIRPYLFGGQPDITPVDWNFVYFSKAAQTASPPMYVCACPLQGNITPSPIFNGVAFVGVSYRYPPVKLTPGGPYYFRVQATLTGGQVVTSGEYSATAPSLDAFGNNLYPNRISITLPVNFQVASWRVYMGTMPGGENKYISVAGGVTFAAINNSTIFTNGAPLTSLGGALTRLFCYDLVLKAWAVIDLPFPISVLKQFRTQGTIPITAMGGFSDGALRRWLGGAGFDIQWDAGAVNAGAPDADVDWSVRTPQVFGKDASDRVYFRQLAVRGVGNPTGMTTKVTVSGSGGKTLPTRNLTVTPMGGGEFSAYADIGVTGVDGSAILQGDGPIEIQSVDWLAVAKSVRGQVKV